MASSATGMIRPPGAGRGLTAAGDRQTLDAVGHDPAVDDTEAAGRRRAAAVQDGPRGPEGRVPGDDRVVRVEHERAVRIHELGEASLDRAVRLERCRGDRGGPT